MTDTGAYGGGELELFAKAGNWKAYYGARLRPFIRGRVLEVGAGLGATTAVLCRPQDVSDWLCLEPDPRMSAHIARQIADGTLPPACRVATGTTNSQSGRFDAIVYIDVLEHIEDDAAELHRAAGLLEPGGHIVTLSPAFQSLYTAFDAAIGHHRRYGRRMVEALTPTGCRLELVTYLDSVGMLASLANRVLLRSGMPTEAQILTWDRLLIPLSRLVDPLLGRWLGRSILAVWRKS